MQEERSGFSSSTLKKKGQTEIAIEVICLISYQQGCYHNFFCWIINSDFFHYKTLLEHTLVLAIMHALSIGRNIKIELDQQIFKIDIHI